MTKNSCPKCNKSKNVLEISLSKPLSPRPTLTHLSCSPNFPRASITRYTHAKHEQILKWQMCIANVFYYKKKGHTGSSVDVFLPKLKKLNLSNKKLPFIALGQRVGVVSGIIASQHRRLQVNVVFSFPYNRIIIMRKKPLFL